MWRETPAPYGPLFLWIGKSISAITGEDIVAAVLCHRLVVLLGVGLIVWATPRLARRCGVAEVSALWLGAANPLLIMHLVAGIHNEALMLGLMLAGTEFALRGIDSVDRKSTRLNSSHVEISYAVFCLKKKKKKKKNKTIE